MKYLVFDCHYFCWRAFHSSGSLSHNGQGTGVIYGFLMQVLIMAKKFSLNEPVFMWDSRKRYRKEILPTYKQRDLPKTEEEVIAFQDAVRQIKVLKNEVLPVIGLNNSFLQPGLEADDLIAMFVKERPGQSIVLSNDQDLFQLLDDCVLFSPAKNKLMNKVSFHKEYGIAVRDWRRVKQIAGCTSDKVPGIVGVGEKTAIDYLKGRLKPESKKYKDIVAGTEIIKRNMKLVNLPHERTKPIKLGHDEFDRSGFVDICEQYGFSNLAAMTDEWSNYFGGRHV